MIERYTLPEMAEIWTDSYKMKTWLQVEIAVCEAQAELGKIPQEETQQQTLPIFDNHKVAKRFCDRRGKIIKLPNGNILQKTSSYLHAKGITRLLINGKIYSLL